MFFAASIVSGIEAMLDEVVKAVISICTDFLSTRNGLNPFAKRIMTKNRAKIRSAETAVQNIPRTDSSPLSFPTLDYCQFLL